MSDRPSLPLFTPLSARVAALSEARWGRAGTVRILGTSPALHAAQARVLPFARTDRPVLIQGETGVGKELFARSVYLLSARREAPFVPVNCAQFSDETLLVSELFGHKRGAFTGATCDRPGLFEIADGGVLFLDELGELPPRAQAALLRAVGSGEVVRLGESEPRRVDVRLISATNRDLRAMARAGTFREDLYYRLAPLRVTVPPLRDRLDDWHRIADVHLATLCRQAGIERTLSARAAGRLARYDWPGNVREVHGVLDVAFCLSEGASVGLAAVAAEIAHDTPAASAEPDLFGRLLRGEATFWVAVRDPFLDRQLNRAEVRALVARALGRCDGSYKRALRALGVEAGDYLKFMDFLRHHRLKPGAPAAPVVPIPITAAGFAAPGRVASA